MSTTFNRIVTLGIIVAMIALTAMLLTEKTFGSAPSGLPATLATSTMLTLASRTATTVLATSTCAARIVSTTDKQIMLTFSDYNNAAPSGTFGHMQLASTTVVYDSGVYGCGLVKVWGDAATNITVTETR